MTEKNKKIICLTPVYNDWESFSILLNVIEKQFYNSKEAYSVNIVAVNDGSLDEFNNADFNSNLQFEIVSLKNNVGH